MEHLTDGRGAELSWGAGSFALRYRFDYVALGLASALTIATIAMLWAGITYHDDGAIRQAVLSCVGAYIVASLWAATWVLAPGHVARRLLARDRALWIDGKLESETRREVVLDPPPTRGRSRVRLVVGERAYIIASVPHAMAEAIALALADALGVVSRTRTPAEALAWRPPRGAVLRLAVANVALYLGLGALQLAAISLDVHAPDEARTLAWIAGPLTVLAPIPYWAVVRHFANPRS